MHEATWSINSSRGNGLHTEASMSILLDYPGGSISKIHTEYPRLLHELSIVRKVLGVSTVYIFSDLFSLILEQRLDL